MDAIKVNMFLSRGRSSLIRTSLCILSLISLLFLACLLIPPASAGASDMDWSISPIDNDNYAIEISMANDSLGYAHVTYIDNATRDLYYARETSSGWVIRNIGPTDWYNGADGRARTAIDVDSNGVARIVYSGDNDGIWYVANADSGIPQATGKSGVSLSMDISVYDETHISYVRSNGIYWAIYNWMDMWMEYSANNGMFTVSNICTSVAVDDYGLPYVAFVDSSGWLRCSYPDGEAWNVMQVDDLYNDIDHLSIGINQLGQPVIAYASLSVYYDLLFAEYDGAAWSFHNVDAASSVYDPLSMDVDDNGVAHVAYIDKHTNTLRYATNDNGWSTAPVTAPLGVYECGGIRALADGSVKIAFADMDQTLYLAMSEAADPVPSITSTPITTGQETVYYEYPLTADQTVTWSLSTDAGFLDLESGMVAGTPGTDDAGVYYVNITATNGTTSLSSYQNYTLTIADSWAPALQAGPLDGQETRYYEYRPSFNESVVVVHMETNAPFLALVDEDVKFTYENKYFAGTPTVNDAGEYWMNVTVFSENGKQPYFMNETFVIADSYANNFTNAPADGQETVYYQYAPTFDGPVEYVDHQTNAMFLGVYDPYEKGVGFPYYWYGTPGTEDAGTYYLNITVRSSLGALFTTQNLTFTIGESWAPSLDSAPIHGRVTVPYSYSPVYNETDAIITVDAHPPFLTWNATSGAYEGTPGMDDAGTYWFNMTAESVDGKLELVSNLSFEVLPMPSSLRINSDADMLAAVNEFKWAGDGSADDPFIVTGLVIDSLGIYENSLFIGNVTYSFVVTGNDLGNAGPAGSWADGRSASLYIYNCDGASISNNRLWGSLFGLCLMQCSWISVDENIVELNDYAGIVVLSGCDLISIENNTVQGNWGAYGIWVKGCSYVRMANNTVSSACNAVAVEDDGSASPSYIMFRDNDIDDVWNGLVLINVQEALVMDNAFTNLDPGMSEAAIGVYFGQGMEISGNTVADGWNGIYLYFTSYLELEGNDIAVQNIGVYMEAVSYSYLANGSISADTGVLADECYLCEIRGLDISDGLIGVNVYEGCDTVLVADCSLAGAFIGVKVYVALDTTVLNCTFDTTLGVQDDTSQGTTVSDCVFNGTADGIYAYGSSGLVVQGNTLTNCANAILLEDTVDSSISGNTLSANQADISLDTCYSIMIDGNVITGNRTGASGISLSNCMFLTMYSNAIEDGAITFDINFDWDTVNSHTIAENNTVGGKPVYYYSSMDYGGLETPDDGGQIIIVSSSNLVVTGLQTTSCTIPVQVYSSMSIGLYDMRLTGSGVGVSMIDSSDVRIEGSVITDMAMGILGRHVSHVYIGHSHLVDNYDGIFMSNAIGMCDNISIEQNFIDNSLRYGILFDGVDDSRIAYNVIANSTSYGARIMATNNVTVVENLFFRNNGVGDTYSVPPFQAFDDTPYDNIYIDGRGNFWSEQLGPDDDGDGVVDYFAYELAGGMKMDLYPLSFAFVSVPDVDGRNRTAYLYDADVNQVAEYELFTDAEFLSIDADGKITGTPDACGSFYVHAKATLMGYLEIWQNYTLTVNDTWAPEISGMPGTGKETVEYAYGPQFNETVANVIANTNAPFLSWNGTAFVGTPTVDDAGEYWMNVTVTSVEGLFTSWLNQTFVVEDAWAPSFDNVPKDGQETVEYAYGPKFNETVANVIANTNAPFLSWNGTAFVGTPTLNDAGVYWINVSAASVEGLLGSYQNSTLVIGESWVPTFENVPKYGQETVDYVFGPQFNETAAVTGHQTNAPFLSWNGSAFVGTPTVDDAGVYWINMTAVSVEGLLETYQNSTLVITEAWAPGIVSEPPASLSWSTLAYEYVLEANESVNWAMETNADFLSLVNGTISGTMGAGAFYVNVTATSVDGLLSSWQNYTLEVLADAHAPSVEIVSPINGALLNSTSVLLQWNVTDEGMGVAGIWVKVDGGNWTAVSGSTLTLLLDDGPHTVMVRAADVVGNQAEANATIVVDTTAPAVESFAPQGDVVDLDAPIVVTFSEAMDAGSVTVTVNGEPATLSWNGTTATAVGDWGYDSGYAVIINGRDLAGNAMEQAVMSFTTLKQLVTISGILLDGEGSPVANASISVNGTVVAVTGADGSYSFQLVPGEYNVTVSAAGYTDASTSLTVGGEPVSLDAVLHATQETSESDLWWLVLVMIAIILGLLYMIRRQF